MRVLIQNIKSGQYLAPHGNWMDCASQAKDFRSTDYAYAVLKAERTPGLRAVFYFEDLDYCVKVRKRYGERLCQRLVAGSPPI